jgi:NAD(P)H-quinone oxidoreductase subunit 5
LASGDAVNHYLRKQYVQAERPSALSWATAFGCVITAAGLVIVVGGWPPVFSPWVLIAIALVSLLAYHLNASSRRLKAQAFMIAGVGLLAYSLFSFVLTKSIPDTAAEFSPLADIWVSTLFIVMFSVFLLLQNAAHLKTQRNWFISLNAGFYLDEWATRLTLRLWPVALPTTQGKYFEPEQQPLNLETNLSTEKVEKQL